MSWLRYDKNWTAILLSSVLVALTARAESPRLEPCPDSPNCVSSLARAGKHRVEPLSFQGDEEAAWVRLRSIVKSMNHATITSATEDYLRAEFHSTFFRFIDDVEFKLDAKRKRIEVRSASRTGYYDFGVNRRRVESIRKAFSMTSTAQ